MVYTKLESAVADLGLLCCIQLNYSGLRESCKKNMSMLTKFKIAAASSKSRVKHQSQMSDIKVNAMGMCVAFKIYLARFPQTSVPLLNRLSGLGGLVIKPGMGNETKHRNETEWETKWRSFT